MTRLEIWWAFAATALLLITAGITALAYAMSAPDPGEGLELLDGQP